MAIFRFKLESVRALREQEERRAQEELARELALAAARHAAAAAADDRVVEARDALAACGGTSLTPQELVARQAFLERRERERLEARYAVDAQERQVEAQRGSLERAAQDREVLERVKRRAQDAHAVGEAKAAEEMLGEIALAAHRRRAVA